MPITDDQVRVVGVCAGCPADSTWEATHKAAAEAIDKARQDLRHLSEKWVRHRRGDFLALAVGISYGGGQKVSRFNTMHLRIYLPLIPR